MHRWSLSLAHVAQHVGRTSGAMNEGMNEQSFPNIHLHHEMEKDKLLVAHPMKQVVPQVVPRHYLTGLCNEQLSGCWLELTAG